MNNVLLSLLPNDSELFYLTIVPFASFDEKSLSVGFFSYN